MSQRSIDPTRLDEDWEGNNIAITCPVCGKVFIVSELIHGGRRECPHCKNSTGFVKGGRKSGGTASVQCRRSENHKGESPVSRYKVPEGCTVIAEDDDSFLLWCANNSKGFVMNCMPRGGGLDPYMLHRVVDGRLCYCFARAEKAHRLTSPDPKVCSMSAEVLWRWANGENEEEPPTKCRLCNPQW